MSEKDKVFCFVVGLKPWAKAKLYEQRVQDLTSAYAVAEQLFDLTSDAQDVRRHQSSSPGRNRNSRPSSPKAVGGDECPGIINRNQAEDDVGQIDGGEKTRIGAKKYLLSLQKKSGERNVPVERGLLYVDTWINQKQTKSTMIDSGATHNFVTEAEARRLKLHWEKDLERMNAVNSVSLPIVELVKRTTIKLGGWKGPVDFVVVKMGDFDVVLGMEFLLEHQVIPMPSAKCLAIIGSFPTVVQADIRQPNEFKMISAMQLDESPAQEEPPSTTILLGALGKLGETVPKDTLCVLEKCHDAPNSWPKSLSMRRTIDHGIELLPEAKASAKNVYRMAPSELAKLWKPSKMLLNTEFSRPVQAPKVLFCAEPENVLGHVVDCHQSGLLREEDTQWSGNLECQAAFNGLKQAMIEGPSLGVVHATKTPKLEANAQTDSLIKKSLFEIKSNRHSMLSPLTDDPYVEDRPQVHRVKVEWEQMADNVRVCLEEASRPMEERIDQKRCPIEFEWMTKLPINSATTPYDYLSTWNCRKTEKSRKSLLTE
ncbi:uncharacterized protein E6C27_scaffold179G00050 [Cucumis melo var. makuwa]|nr:uncharacterized protein E6C27_scaffold179G00050 [Cucumis melo var. makuwa]